LCCKTLIKYQKIMISNYLFQVVIQEARNHCDSIANILEEMKSDPDGNGGNGQGIEVTTGIPVAVSSLGTDPKKTTIKRVAAPASTVILPNKRSRNIIFAGNTLPQGAIPIQVLRFYVTYIENLLKATQFNH
jgi:hypothetical protein